MDPRIIVASGITLVVVFVVLGLAEMFPWQAAGTLTATVIGVVGMILAIERRETGKTHETAICTQATSISEGRLLFEETILVAKDGCSYYQLEMSPNEKVTGEISSKQYFNIYFLTPRNYARQGKGQEFAYEYGTEHASRMKVDFTPKKAGKYYIVIESCGETDIDVDVRLRIENKSPDKRKAH